MAAIQGIIASALGDLTVAEAIASEWILLLAERATLSDHAALLYAGSIDGQRSNVLKVRHAGLFGYDLPSATGDGSTVTNTAFTDGSTTVTVTRQSKAYEATDLARIVANEIVDPRLFAIDAGMSAASRLTELIADIIDGFAATAGTTGNDLTTAILLGAGGTARVNNVEGALMTVLHGQQWSDVVVDAGTALIGALREDPTTIAVMHLMGSGFQGRWLGQDIFTNNRVVTANAAADRAGAVFGRGGVMWGDGTPPVDDTSQQLLVGDKVLFERDRTPGSGETQYVSHYYCGASLGIEAGVSVITDA